MRFKANPYEVRCPQCNVSFPVETKKCMHCGSPTVQVDNPEALQAMERSDYQPFGGSRSASTAGSMGMPIPMPTPTPTPGPVEQDDDSIFQLPDFSSADREIEEAEEPTSIGRTLIRGLGGFVWIIVLIGFTLARNCGGE